jgi:phosphomannomutase
MFQAALTEGVRSTGLDVLDIGQVSTPLMYFAVEHLGVDGGIVVSASHNPPEYNGLKLRRKHATYGSEPLSSEDIQEIGQLANDGAFEQGQGSLQRVYVEDAYVQSVAHVLSLPPGVRPRVVLDGGNGVAGPIAMRALEAVGAEVIPLYIEPDGTFPNHHPDPLKSENLQDLIALVREQGADMGLSLDGDGDRLGVVDQTGTIVWTDRYLIVLARYLLAQRKAPVVFDVKCSNVLIDALQAFGGTPVMWKTGYPNLSAKMRETDAILGGELSGHTITTHPGHYYDDGAFTGAHLLLALAHLGNENRLLPLNKALSAYPPLPSIDEGRIPFSEKTKFQVVSYVRNRFAQHYPVVDVDGARVDFGDGWGLVRTSNTEPAITTRFEAATRERVYAIRDMMLEAVEDFRAAYGE